MRRKTTFVKEILLLLLVLTISFSGFSKEKGFQSHWVSSPVRIDGSTNDWAENDLAGEKKVKVDYAFKNDAENLYVLFMFRDPKYLSSISATGLTIWFNSE